MSSHVYCICVDCHDPETLGRFWSEVLHRPSRADDDGDVWVPFGAAAEDGPYLLFAADPNDKGVKNRLHIDIVPDDQDAEVSRLEALGATQVDIGQGDQTWVVMADPEGNEFCVLAAR